MKFCFLSINFFKIDRVFRLVMPFALIVLLFGTTPLLAQGMRAPQNYSGSAHKHTPITNPYRPISTVRWFFGSAISFFSTVISPVDGSRCPSYPTCAAYGKQAVREEGFFWGVLLIADRLLHEAETDPRTPVIQKYGINRYYDPLDNNRFWLNH